MHQRRPLAAAVRRARRRARADARCSEACRYTVVGVMPRGFSFPDTQVGLLGAGAARAPSCARRARSSSCDRRPAAAGVTAGAARGELDTDHGAAADASSREANGSVALDAQPLLEALVANVSQLLWILMGSVGCVLLIACANLANLLLAQGDGARPGDRHPPGDRRRPRRARPAAARRERRARAASAARRACSAGAGFLDALVAWLPAGIPRIAEAAVDARVLALHLRRRRSSPGCSSAWRRRCSCRAARRRWCCATMRGPRRAARRCARVLVVGELADRARPARRRRTADPQLRPDAARRSRVSRRDRILTFQVSMEGSDLRAGGRAARTSSRKSSSG